MLGTQLAVELFDHLLDDLNGRRSQGRQTLDDLVPQITTKHDQQLRCLLRREIGQDQRNGLRLFLLEQVENLSRFQLHDLGHRRNGSSGGQNPTDYRGGFVETQGLLQHRLGEVKPTAQRSARMDGHIREFLENDVLHLNGHHSHLGHLRTNGFQFVRLKPPHERDGCFFSQDHQKHGDLLGAGQSGKIRWGRSKNLRSWGRHGGLLCFLVAAGHPSTEGVSHVVGVLPHELIHHVSCHHEGLHLVGLVGRIGAQAGGKSVPTPSPGR